jgi:hypothetical protein
MGDLVRVTDAAPRDIPRALGSVCAISTVENETVAVKSTFLMRI